MIELNYVLNLCAEEIERLRRATFDEREACARVCKREFEGYDWADREKDAAADCAAAIRARGEK